MVVEVPGSPRARTRWVLAYLEANGVMRGLEGWQPDDRTGMTLGRDGFLRCRTNERQLAPLCFHYMSVAGMFP